MDAEPKLRPATIDDLHSIGALIASVFPDNPKADPDVLRWQYWDNPFGPPSSWVWEHDDKLVSHFSVFAVPGRIAGRPTLLAKTADAATLPAYRGRRLFPKALKAAAAECAVRGVPVILCHPANPASLRGLDHAGMRTVARVPAYVLPLDDAWLAGRFHLPRPVAASIRRTIFSQPSAPPAAFVAAPPDGLDELWAKTALAAPNSVTHDAKWWRWRYAQRPGGQYHYLAAHQGAELVGAAAVTFRDAYGGRFAHILDLLAADADGARSLIAGLREDPHGAVGAGVLALPNSRIARLATSAGFRKLPKALEPRAQHFGIVGTAATDADQATKADTLAAAPWSLIWGDLDHL